MENGMTKPQDAPLTSDAAKATTGGLKSYKRPQLQVYGDLATITQMINTTGITDGASHPNKHFTS